LKLCGWCLDHVAAGGAWGVCVLREWLARLFARYGGCPVVRLSGYWCSVVRARLRMLLGYMHCLGPLYVRCFCATSCN
ncbi:hypothetical protein COCCADRAFT_105870, partial [Bipolaris zeicola 26-R-13]